jgi:hypothetical protein
MPKSTFSAALLAVLALPLHQAVAGPPEQVPGKMVFDVVADGLRKYRKETDEEKRIKWLRNLAPSGDPRVAIALGEAFAAWKPPVGGTYLYFPGEGHIAGMCLASYRFTSTGPAPASIEGLRRWWHDNEAALRRRAAQLPR